MQALRSAPLDSIFRTNRNKFTHFDLIFETEIGISFHFVAVMAKLRTS